MKIKHKKFINTVVAVFMAVLLAGGVFAFAAQGPLRFEGTASVDASLALAIVESDLVITGGAVAGYDLSIEVEATNGEGHRRADMNAEFDGIGQSATFSFVVENIGTITAQIDPIALVIDPETDTRLVWTQEGALATSGEILAPGETVEFSFIATFDTEGFTGWEYKADSTVSFILHYGLVGVTPGAVAVADIDLTVQGRLITREWTSAGTRGWEDNDAADSVRGSADWTASGNIWHRSGQMNGRVNGEPITRWPPSFGGLAILFGLDGFGSGGQGTSRHVIFTLNVQYVDGNSEYIFENETFTWINVGYPATYQTFVSGCGRFELTMRASGTQATMWQLVDTSGVNADVPFPNH